MVYGGIHWSGTSVGGMGESKGGVSPSKALTFHWLHLSGLMVGHLGGGWVAGWLGEGRGDHAPCAIACICHFTLNYPILGESLV